MDSVKTEWIKVKHKKMSPLVIDFLLAVALDEYKLDSNYFFQKHPKYPKLGNKNWFYGIDLKKSNPILLNSGDRIMRQLIEDGLIKVDCIFQSDGIYRLNSKSSELKNAKSSVLAGGFTKIIDPQLNIFKN
jgi:hypothetical protein